MPSRNFRPTTCTHLFFYRKVLGTLNHVPPGTALIQPNLLVPSDTIRYFEFSGVCRILLVQLYCARSGKNQQVPIDYEISNANFRRATCTHFFFFLLGGTSFCAREFAAKLGRSTGRRFSPNVLY